ncbi:uncharacterized protein LOC128548244 [Mercenaria mercenaria]|uniref:uncharacterized protein LOC128548244 n=1 Tax=Mercenaria mercenaria TaxID=6596 RepID=UPI00234F3FAA|nr:uncharacterized protein LOC128548244 [Mercenaria mercenaria]
MGTHITGVLSHGHNLFMNYVDLLEYPHDPNLTINILLKSLLKIVKTKGSLPPILFLQADNCRRENKNKYVFAFLELLVRQRIFREVYFSVLIVGHTHEDIDAAFSKISRSLKKKSAETLPDLLQCIPNVERVGEAYDVKSWLGENICDVKGTSEPLHYKFVASGNNVKVFYKGLQHTFWKQLNGRGTFLRKVPSGNPKLLKPDYSKFDLNIEKLKKLVSSVEGLFSDKEKFNWWADFIPNVKTYALQNTPKREWINVLPKQPLFPKSRSSLSLLDPYLKKVLEKESAEPELTCEKATLKVLKSKKRKLQKTVKVRKGSVKSAGAQVKRKQHNQKQKQGKPKNKNHGKFQKSNKRSEVKQRQQNRMMIIPIVDDIKKHIWLIIFFYLVDLFISFTALFLFLFHLLYFITTVDAIVQQVNVLWEVLLRQHIGCQFVHRNSARFVIA